MWFSHFWYGNQTNLLITCSPPSLPCILSHSLLPYFSPSSPFLYPLSSSPSLPLPLPLQRHEIERLGVWQNPTGLPDRLVPGEEEVVSWVNPTQSERHWRSTIVMAYQASPHLAFHLINRSHDGHMTVI